MKCPQCGHDTLMQQEQDGAFYKCGFCGHSEYRCPECGSEMEPIVRGGITMPTNPKPYLFECKKCGHESKLEGGDFKKAVRKKFGNPIDFSDIPIEEVGGGKE